jgi:dihydroorotate dehydrogenase (NAD+) catalytic subunit
MLYTPFYNPNKSYEENFQAGPYGDFADGKIFKNSGEPKYDFLGIPVYSTFGIPAGPLPNANFCKAAFEKGFDICVYKTVRSGLFPCHPWPNVLPLAVEGDLTLEKLKSPLVVKEDFSEPLSITNSFGVPQGRTLEEWQADVKKAISYTGIGQVLVLSFMGTVREGQTQEDFINDNILAAKLAYETGAKVLEINLSCPNIGNEGLVCYNLDVTERILKGVRDVISSTPLIMKIGYFKDEGELKKLAQIADKYAQSISSINTLQATVVDKDGNQALPGKMRAQAGVCGAGIKWAGLDMVKRLKKIKEENNYKFSIEGVGGVINTEDYFEYKNAGADSVMSATGAMWNPHLAEEIKTKL